MVHPFNGAARKSLPPLDRSCVFHSCWLGVPLGADSAALFFLLSQVDYNLVQDLSWAPFAVPGLGLFRFCRNIHRLYPPITTLLRRTPSLTPSAGSYAPAPGDCRVRCRLMERFGQVQLGMWDVCTICGPFMQAEVVIHRALHRFHTSTASTSQPNISLASGGLQGPDPILRASAQ